jgi:quinol monooxygenase YgiN
MIVRIVKMKFKIEAVQNFTDLFQVSKEKIKNFEGCKYVELLNDTNDTCCFFTYSHWESESHLEQYRQSELFKTTWAKTRVLFAEKPEVWTLKKM